MTHFTLSEFDSPDIPGSGEEMKSSFLRRLDEARELAGVPFKISSGYRTPEHNEAVGGVFNSSHTKGHAADIVIASSEHRYVIVRALIEVGFNRIGIANSFVHVDNDPAKTPNVIWTY